METLTIKRGLSKKAIKDLLSAWVSKRRETGIDAKRFSGVVKLKKDPIEIQKELRSEWD